MSIAAEMQTLAGLFARETTPLERQEARIKLSGLAAKVRALERFREEQVSEAQEDELLLTAMPSRDTLA